MAAVPNSSKNRVIGYYFEDGLRRTDYVIMWNLPISSVHSDEDKKQIIRDHFIESLFTQGVDLEKDVVITNTVEMHYLKVHIPWKLMCTYAEIMKLRVPISKHERNESNWSARMFTKLRIPNFMNCPVAYRTQEDSTCLFVSSKIKGYIGHENHDKFFSPTQRHQVAYEILASNSTREFTGIDHLIQEDIFAGAYPVHDGPYHVTEEDLKEPENMNSRQILYWYWARWGCWYKYQPLDLIRNYYGEKITLYFAWLGLYTSWLFLASIVGLFVVFYGIFTLKSDVTTKEICSDTITNMCSLCDERQKSCPNWRLSDVCIQSYFSHLFDNGATVFFSIFIIVWAVTFLESWKRKCACLTHEWSVMDYRIEEERPRPQYAALCSEILINPITGVTEPHFSTKVHRYRIIFGLICILFMMLVVMIFTIAVIIYRVIFKQFLSQSRLLSSKVEMFANISAAIINLVLIVSLGYLYEMIALKMTEWEMHRTQTEFENSLTFKVFVFQFLNYYSSLFYVAFFKSRFTGTPGKWVMFLGLRQEICHQGGCLFELSQQLIVIMVGKQLISNCQEIVIPWLKNWFHNYSMGLNRLNIMTKSNKSSRFINDQESTDLELVETKKFVKKELQPIYVEDSKMVPYEGLLEEYLEMVLQFGFITIFILPFPLAPLFALLNNWMEIRLDAQKLVCSFRRPCAERAQNIGIWFNFLQILVRISVIINAFMLAFTSEFIPKEVYKYMHNNSLSGYTNFTLAWAPIHNGTMPCRYKAFFKVDGSVNEFYWKLCTARLGFIIAVEHFVFFFTWLLDYLIPDIPSKLSAKIKRERYIAKQSLQQSIIADVENCFNEKT